jgi:hypothetical protein
LEREQRGSRRRGWAIYSRLQLAGGARVAQDWQDRTAWVTAVGRGSPEEEGGADRWAGAVSGREGTARWGPPIGVIIRGKEYPFGFVLEWVVGRFRGWAKSFPATFSYFLLFFLFFYCLISDLFQIFCKLIQFKTIKIPKFF